MGRIDPSVVSDPLRNLGRPSVTLFITPEDPLVTLGEIIRSENTYRHCRRAHRCFSRYLVHTRDRLLLKPPVGVVGGELDDRRVTDRPVRLREFVAGETDPSGIVFLVVCAPM